MRHISIDLSSDNYSQQPQIFGGYAGEHNETILHVTLPKRMLSVEYSDYHFDFQTSEDNKIPIPASKDDKGVVSCRLTEQITIAGKLSFNVVAIKQLNQNSCSLVSKTNMVTLYIGNSPDGNDIPYDPNGYKDEILAMIDARILEINPAQVDQSYDAKSIHAQSGKAVAEAVQFSNNVTYDVALKNTVSGKTVLIEDGIYSQGLPIEVSVSGVDNHSGVKVYKGAKNLLPIAPNKTVNGVTLSYIADGDYYVLNGTATADSNIGVVEGLSFGNGKYTLSANNILATEAYNAIIQLYSPSKVKNHQVWVTEVNSSTVFDLVSADDYIFRIKTKKGVVYDNYIIKPQLELGSVPTDYSAPSGVTTHIVNSECQVENIFATSSVMSLSTNNEDAIITVEYAGSPNNIVHDLLPLEVSHPIRKNYTIDEGKVIALENDLNEWKLDSISNAKIETDEIFTKTGQSGLRVSITQAGGDANIRKRVNLDMSKKKNRNISVQVYLGDEPSKYSGMSIRLGNLKQNAEINASFDLSLLRQGWNRIHVSADNWNILGNMTWNDVAYLMLYINDNQRKMPSVVFSDVRVGWEYSPKIIFRFDDGFDNVATTAMPILNEAGLKGSMFIISSKIGVAGFCTLEQLQTVYANGNDVGNHTVNHKHANQLTYAETLSEIEECENWLIENGFTKSARHFALPFGETTEKGNIAAEKLKLLTRTVTKGTNNLPTEDAYWITGTNIPYTMTVEEVSALIDKSVSGGETLVLMFHQIVDNFDNVAEGDMAYAYLTEDFQSIVNYIVQKDYSKYVVTMSDWYEGLNRE